MKIIEATKDQVNQILNGEQIRISLVETEVKPLDDLIFKNGSQVVGVRALRAFKANIQDTNIEEMYMEGIRVTVHHILEHGPSYPSDFDTWEEERKDKYFKDAAIATYIAQCELSQNIEEAYIKRWNNSVQSLNKKYRYENNPVVTVVEFEISDS